MPKKPRTTQSRRRPRSTVLEVRVMSPRIAWLGFLRFVGRLTKLACILAVVTGIGWGIWQGIQRAFYHNPDFRLQVIDLNPNTAIDEVDLAEATGLDLTASLFDIDAKSIAEKLSALPEIASARAERHLPGKLVVRVVPRTPQAWIATSSVAAEDIRHAGSLVVDSGGIAYPCPVRQLPDAEKLPVIILPPSHDIDPGKVVGQPELAHCARLLEAVRTADPEAIAGIESITQVNEWSLLLVTRQGTQATFAIGDHERQIANFRAAIDHSSRKGYAIDTINLIPKHNIPITVRGGEAMEETPKATVIAQPAAKDARDGRRARDLDTLLNRN